MLSIPTSDDFDALKADLSQTKQTVAALHDDLDLLHSWAAAKADLAAAQERLRILEARNPAPISSRIASLNIGAKNYDDPAYQAAIAKAAIAVMGFFPGWRGDKLGEKISAVLLAIKTINPKILLGQYTNVMESVDDKIKDAASAPKITKLDAMNWWLRNAAGQKVQWTSAYNTWDINITKWAPPDENGDRFPEWYAKYLTSALFSKIPFDFAFSDNCLVQSRVPAANWKLDGTDTPSGASDVALSFRQGQTFFWNKLRELNPGLSLCANTAHDCSSPEYRGQLEYALLEKMIGASWSMETTKGWRPAYDFYLSASRNSLNVIFCASGAADNIQRVRYGLCTTLLGNGYFCYSDDAVGYSSTPWYPLYDLPLGFPIEPPPTQEFRGKWYRKYQNGLVMVDPANKDGRISINS